MTVNTALIIRGLILNGAAIIAFANAPLGEYPKHFDDRMFSEEFRKYSFGGRSHLKFELSDD